MKCRKHAFARRASSYPRIVPSSVRVLPDEWYCSPSLDPPSGRDRNDDYIYGPSTTPVEEVSLANSTPTYMTYTPSDSSWLITNAAGDETAFYGYDAFGNLAFGTPASPFGYAGQYTDPSTGFSNLRARWYAPQTGTFTTRDPAFTSTDTAYTYAADDPVNGADPSGQLTVGYCGSGVVGIVGGIGGEACLTRTQGVPNDDIGVVGSSIKGLGLFAGVGVGIGVELSNADYLQSLRGSFAFISLGVDIASIGIAGISLNGLAFVGTDARKASHTIFGITLGVGVDVGLPAGQLFGIQETGVHKFGGWDAEGYRLAWDVASTIAPIHGIGLYQRILDHVATFLQAHGWGSPTKAQLDGDTSVAASLSASC
jgi:RHS repeat-associated protein